MSRKKNNAIELSTKIKKLLLKRVGRTPLREDCQKVNVVRDWISKGEVKVYYNLELIGQVKLIKELF